MFRCSNKKINWYRARNLVDQIDSTTFRLKFRPNGLGHAHDPFYLAIRDNACVVCGDKTALTRHHIVPHCYRRHMGTLVKDNNYHDIVMLCIYCHTEYEKHADLLRVQLGVECGVPLGNGGYATDDFLVKVQKSAAAVLKWGDKIPPHRREELLAVVRQHHGRQDVLVEDLKAASTIEWQTKVGVGHGEAVAKAITDPDEFVQRWRLHFIETMKPGYLPPLWDIYRPAARTRN